MANGKNKIERGFRFTYNSQDMSADLVPGSVSGGGLVYDEVDMTGVSNAIKNYLAGHPDSTISANFHMNDTDSTGTTTVLNAAVGTANTLLMEWGASGAAPTTDDPIFSGSYLLLGAPIALDGNKFVHQCTFRPGSATAPVWALRA